MEGQWTRERPTEAGWYWFWVDELKGKQPWMRRVRRGENGTLYVGNSFIPVEHGAPDYWWYGPITPPAPPTVQSSDNTEEAQP